MNEKIALTITTIWAIYMLAFTIWGIDKIRKG